MNIDFWFFAVTFTAITLRLLHLYFIKKVQCDDFKKITVSLYIWWSFSYISSDIILRLNFPAFLSFLPAIMGSIILYRYHKSHEIDDWDELG